MRWVALAAVLLLGTAARAQNVVADGSAGRVAPRTEVSLEAARRLIDRLPAPPPRPAGPEARALAARLEAHVADLVRGFPFKAFHNTLGISGYEAYFDHPDELFYSLSLSLPYLGARARADARALLDRLLEQSPPYGIEGFDRLEGRPREAYDVPGGLRAAGRGRAASAFGVYAFWAYCHAVGGAALAREHWDALKQRMAPLLTGAYRFDPTSRSYRKDEAEVLNGDLAGLIGFARLARLAGDAASEEAAVSKARELLELRVNLERLNPRVLEPTEFSTKHLHVYKLARYCDLVPEVAEALRSLTDGCSVERLRAFRQARNAWFMAFGERLIGGENYTNPPHFARALFAGAALVERLPARDLFLFVDIPWCRGDLYFLEKAALALRRAGEGQGARSAGQLAAGSSR